MKQYPSNRVLKKKLSNIELFDLSKSFENSDSPYWIREIFSNKTSEIIDKTVSILGKLNTEECSRYTFYFQVGNEDEGYEDLGSEYDTCDDDDCISSMYMSIFESYPNQKINQVLYANDGDHENIGRCNICYKPLNSWLTWVNNESEYFIRESVSFSKELIKNNSFNLMAIFQSLPSMDYKYEHQREKWYPLEKFKKDCYKFYGELLKLAIYINQNFK